MRATLKVDLFADFVCPWCLVGSARLDSALASLPQGIKIDVENHPFYLDPDTPEDGVVVADMLRERYGREPKEMWSRVEQEARISGIDLDLSRQPRMYPTAKAHTLTRLARNFGQQHAFANAIADAYFLDHRQINDDSVLADIAEGFGFERDQALAVIHDDRQLSVTAELAASAAQNGIRGVPFFIFNNRFALSGAQPLAVFEAAIEKALGDADAAA